MDLALLDQYGLPISMVVAFGWYIWKQNQWIQQELESDMEASFARQEAIIIELINQQKTTQMELAEIKGYIAGIESILQRLTGNGLSKGKKK